MSNGKDKKQYFPPDIDRDHARPRHAPAPSNEAVEARLAELISPATYALTDHYRRLGLRWRVLNLPVMVGAILAMIWRQVPSLSTLARMIAREPLLWAPPRQVSQQALSLRLRCLPAGLFAELFSSVVPLLRARASSRHRPQPAVVERALRHFEHLWLLDATTLEALFHKVGLLRETSQTTFGGKLLALLDLPSKLPIQLWLDENATANEKRHLDERLQALLQAGTLLVFDLGFYSFPFFDWLGDKGLGFVTRARAASAYHVQGVLLQTASLRDRVITLGVYRSNPCQHPVRLVEVCLGGTWHGYLTNILEPERLSTADVVDLYGRRWRLEDAFLLVKRLLGLSYLWTGAFNGVALQVWATWLLYSMLLDLSDAVAEELDLPLDRISLEMVYRGLYHFCVAYQQGEASDPVTYLAQQTDLGIVKRRRKYRERAPLDKIPPGLNL